MKLVNQQITSSMSQSISLLKGLAIFSVICAHCNTVPENANGFVHACSHMLANLGTVGVICFFIISGFLFRCESKKTFFSKRLVALGAPWIIGSVAVYLYVALRNPPLSLSGFLNFMIGNGSYFYYLTILFLFYLTFAFVPFLKRTIPLLVLIVTGIVSGLLFSDGTFITPTPYLNYFNWVGYFALGVLIRTYLKSFVILFDKLHKLRFCIYVAYLIILTYQIITAQNGYYFGFPEMFFAWCGAISFLLLSVDIKEIKCIPLKRALQSSGDSSLFIYIWHMPIAGIIANLFSYHPFTVLVIVRPFVVLAIVLSAGFLANFILRKIDRKKLGIMIGLRG